MTSHLKGAHALLAGRSLAARWLLTVHVLEDVEDGQDLSVVRHQRLPHHVSGHHQVLQHLQGGADHLPVPGVQGVWGSRGRGQRSGVRGQGPGSERSVRQKVCRAAW